MRARTAVVAGLIPLLTAGALWVLWFAFDDRAEKLMTLSIIGAGLSAAGFWAFRRGTGRWTPLWVLGAGVSGIVWFYAIGLLLLASSDTSGGCPGGRIYC